MGGGSVGTGFGRGRLNSRAGWTPTSKNIGEEWFQIDSGEVQSIVGIVTQGRRDANIWVTEYSVKASMDGITWSDVQCGRIFKANVDRNSKVKKYFRDPIRARFIRIFPEAWQGMMGMRAGIIVCERPCKGGELDYHLDQGSLMSSTFGPSLDARWGGGEWDDDGWHFGHGEGLRVDQDEEGCMNNHVAKPKILNTAYSIQITVRLSKVHGWNRIIGSQGWGDTGLYVRNHLQMYPTAAGMKCAEVLVHDVWYDFFITRTDQGLLKLYINGALCARGRPNYNDAFSLHQHRIDFFHDDGSEHASGVVKDIHIWNRALTGKEILSMAQCKEATKAKACPKTIVYSPPSSDFLYSSIWDNDKPGTGHARGRLNSAQAWSAKAPYDKQWLQIDTGEVQSISGVVVQGRRNYRQWVTAFYVDVSSDGTTWEKAGCGMRFAGNTDPNTKLKVPFYYPIKARYVRIKPAAWYAHPSMRAGVMLCERPCVKGELDYTFQSSLLSDTQGPPLYAVGGEGTFVPGQGYKFMPHQGLILDESACISQPEEWSIFMDVKLDSTSGWQMLMTSGGWGDYGLYVNGEVQMYPPAAGIKCAGHIHHDRFYKFILTRDKDGHVKLYLNGYPCSEGYPAFLSGFKPDAEDIAFFKNNDGQYQSSGIVKRLRLWDYPLSEAEAAEMCDCKLTQPAKKCDKTVIQNPPDSRYAFSTTFQNRPNGQIYAAARLHSRYSWSAATCQVDTQWLQIDTGTVQQIEGVVTQGRRDYGQWVTSFKVMVSDDGKDWKDVQCGFTFTANTNQHSKVKTLFDKVVKARYIRIFPQTWYGWMSMRAGAIICEKQCQGGQLDFKLQDDLASSTEGPSLTVPWGIGHWSATNGYRFDRGQGFQLDAETCMNAGIYTIYLRVRFDNAAGRNRLVASGGWSDYGFYIWERKFILYPKSALMECDEIIFNNEWYHYVMTRDKEGTVTMYLNGYKCSQGQPLFLDGFSINPEMMQFLKDFGSNQGSGYVKHIRTWKTALDPGQVAELTGCTLNTPAPSSKCQGKMVESVPYSRIEYSSTWNNDRKGVHHHGMGRLNSHSAWCARHNNVHQWFQLDAGQITILKGVVTQGRNDYWQWVTSYRIDISSDGKTWEKVDCGRVFSGNNNRHTKVENLFDAPLKARYVRIMPWTWHGHISMRAGLLVCEIPCQSSELDYKFQDAFTSSLFGPPLVPEWGSGRFSSSKGYVFNAGQGLRLDEHKCIKQPGNGWTILIKGEVVWTHGWRRILNSRGWGDFGFYIRDGLFQVYPVAANMKCPWYILPNEEVTYVISRSSKGEVSMYQNGLLCATGKPAIASRFTLDPRDVTFFRDDGSENTGGSVRRIRMWNRLLSSAEVASESDCEPLEPSEKCDRTEIISPDNNRYTSTRCWANDKFGYRYCRPQLDSPDAWVPDWNFGHWRFGQPEENSAWLQIDAGKVQTIEGVVTQGRYAGNQHVTSFAVKVSSDGHSWADVDCGNFFRGKDYRYKTENKFADPVSARYVRIYPKTWHGWPSLRAGLLLCAAKCKDKELDYEFKNSLQSSTSGPALDASWGNGYFTKLNNVYSKGKTLNGVQVYRYHKGQGFQIDSTTCLKDQKEWTFIIQVRIDDTNRMNRILGSETWRRYGLFVKDRKLTMFPDDLEITCAAHLFSGQMYHLAMTREKDGAVKLYLDGYLCASGSIADAPKKGLSLDLETIQFLHDPNGFDGNGYVQQIQMFGSALTPGDVQKKCDCDPPKGGKECSGQIVMNVDYSAIRYDSVLYNGKVGTGWARGRLNSRAAWIAPNYNQGHWMQMDIGSVSTVAGVATQGRYGYGWWTTSFLVRVSENGKDWSWVECGRRFKGNVNWNSKLDTIFDTPVKGRYVRIYPVTSHGLPSLRAAVLICETKCQQKELVYNFNDALTSSTGGPNLDAPWGTGTYTTAVWNNWQSTGDGYRFQKNQGLQVDESKCITDPQEYTVLIEAKFDSVSGERAILTSEDWFDDGLFIVDGIYQMRPSPALQCEDEPIRAGYEYKFAVTRKKKTGKVDLYLNGYRCASGKPNANSGFALEPNNMIFFRGPSSHSMSGWVQKIEILDKALSSDDIMSKAGCETPRQEAEACDDTTAFVPETSSYTASSIYANYKMGWAHYGQPRIGDQYCWSPDTNQCYGWWNGGGCNKGSRETWLQVDAGKVTPIAGVVTQGRHNYGRWVKTFKIKVSEDGVSFKDVECGRIFDGNTDGRTKVKNLFRLPVKARYVRFYPDTCYYNCDMRVGLLMCETACESGHLDYKLTTGVLSSATGGPQLHAPWGQGTFDKNSGYVFRAGQGLHVDESKCVEDKETYSILINAKLNHVSKNRALLTNDEWAENGLTVQDGVFKLIPTKLSCPEVIRTGYYYNFGITRSKKGVVSLYINGYKCATGSPVSMEGYPLESNNIQFLRGVSEGQSSSGAVKRIQIWNKELSSTKMAEECNCDPPEQAKRCESTVEFVPEYDKYSASSIYANYKMGSNHYGKPRIGDPYCWRPKTNSAGKEWLQIDAGSVKTIAGLVTQGRSNYARWVKTLKVQVSLKGKNWLWVECGRIFNANTDTNSKAEILFDYPVKARYVRIYQETCYYNCDLRAGLLLCESGCENDKLDYRLTSSLVSVTQGPSLKASWGLGSFSSSKGYRVQSGKGLEVDESKCIKGTKTWSVLIDARLDAVDKTRGLMTSPEWIGGGLYVKDGKFQLMPTSIVCDVESIRSSYYYKFGATRTAKGVVTLYLNGYPCASGEPVSAAGFPLDPTKLIFMRGSHGGSGSGYVKDITIWQKTLDSDGMLDASGCELPESGSKCNGIVQYVPSYAKFSASSIYGNYKMGQAHYGQPRIGDPYCWKAASNTPGKEWLQIDLGKSQKVTGVVTQGRGNYARWVKTFKVMVSQKGKTWKYVECGRIFDGNKDYNTLVKNEFVLPVKARFVRIYPETSYYGFDMRAGVLLCETLCSSGELNYDLREGLTSTTGGPSLEAPWGLGVINSDSGYRFQKEKGLELDESHCVKKQDYWSVLMNVKLDKVDGYRSLMTSNLWKGNGPAVLDGTFVVKPTALTCLEPIRTGYYYKYGVTRTKDDQVTLYLNGYPCMTAKPTSSKGFELELENLIFFRGMMGESSPGYVKQIQVWQKTLNAKEMLSASECKLPQESTDNCTDYIYYSPSYDKYTASSIYGNYKMGWDHYGHPKLGESYCWKAQTNTPGKEWLQIDTSSVQAIAGVVVQGRSNYGRWVKTFKVMVSQKGKNWKYVECGRIFDGNKDYTSKVEVVFRKPVQARYVRIYPETSYHGFDMRAAVLLCEQKCKNKHLEYDLTAGLTSESGGPSLKALQGDGSFDANRGYRFQEGQGLQVDESRCIQSPKSYTIYMDVRLDKVDKIRALVTADSWDTAGLYVKDSNLRLMPKETNIVCEEPVRPNYFYRFAMTRTKSDGQVTIYLNGYPCASGKPKSASGFVLDPDSIIFLRGRLKQSSGGYVKKIEVWDKALTAKEIKEHSGCTMPGVGKACTGHIQTVPPTEKWTASSIYANYKMGWAHYGRPRLDDSYAWLPKKQAQMDENGRSEQKNDEWLQVDLGGIMRVAGLITQGRSNAWQFTKTYKVMVSDNDKTWKPVECGRIFDANVNYYDKKQNLFAEPVKARYVRIYPETCYSYCALRVGIVLCEKECSGGQLDYNLADGDFQSQTNGPMMTTPWGQGNVVKDQGYRFSENRGFKVEESACITDPTVYSVMVDARLDKVDGDRSLMQSESWGPTGLYVSKDLLRWKPSSIICKTEPIRANRYYRFGMTVENGKVVLYLNGAQCAVGKPGSGPGTKLDADSMTFFRYNDNGKSLASAGYVKRIQIWKKALSAKEMAKAAGCSFPPEGKQCKTGDVVHVPPHSKYSMSSCWHWWSKMGNDVHALPKINSASAWVAQKQNEDQWLQIDAGKKQDIVGVVTQGRASYGQWVKAFKVSVSDDGKEFTDVECGRIFDGNTNQNTKVRNYFTSPIKARYVRVHPVMWHSYISMRLGILTCETQCSKEKLDYQMQGSESSTGGPVLHYPWGTGFFIPKVEAKGVDFPGYDIQYLNIDPADCIGECKKRRNCVGVVQRNGENQKGCWLKYEMRNFRTHNDIDAVYRTDTLYYKLRTPYGYRVDVNKGIEVSPGACIQTKKEYTLIIEMRLDSVTGRAKRLISSKDWGQRGAFVYNSYYAMYPWFRGLKCQEDIKAGFFYKFGLSRTKDKKVSMYLNGWKCASAHPPYADAFALDEDSFSILHDQKSDYNTGGWVRRIQLWKDALSDADMLSENKCSLSVMKEQVTDQWEFCANQAEDCTCEGVIRYGDPASDRWSGPHMTAGGKRNCNDGEFGDPAYGIRKICQCNKYYPTIGVQSNKVTYSSIRDNNADEWGKGNGLNTEACWSPSNADMDEWLQIDLAENKTIGGFATQGDPRRGWQVTGLVVRVSYDGENWLDVQCGRIWNTKWEGNSNKIYSVFFEKAVVARYLRFIPVTWANWPALRISVMQAKPVPPPPPPPPPPSKDDQKKDKKGDGGKKDDGDKKDDKKEASTETLTEKKLIDKDGKSLLNSECAKYRDML